MPNVSEFRLQEKLHVLKKNIDDVPSAAIAFSGGVDSTLLAAVAQKTIPGRVLLVTASASFFPRLEFEETTKLAQFLKIPQKIIKIDENKTGIFTRNSSDRCYWCKRAFFEQIKSSAQQSGYEAVMDGSNCDDLRDYRPGLQALKELGIRSPLREAGFTKKEIRTLSRKLQLPTADKPSMACLVSRFPYGEKITHGKMKRVEISEEGIRQLGISQLRVRSHGDMARIEVDSVDMDVVFRKRDKIVRVCKEAGFVYVSLDLEGYRSGAMNELSQ